MKNLVVNLSELKTLLEDPNTGLLPGSEKTKQRVLDIFVGALDSVVNELKSAAEELASQTASAERIRCAEIVKQMHIEPGMMGNHMTLRQHNHLVKLAVLQIDTRILGCIDGLGHMIFPGGLCLKCKENILQKWPLDKKTSREDNEDVIS